MEYKFNIGDIVLDDDNNTVLICDRNNIVGFIIYDVITFIDEQKNYLNTTNRFQSKLTNNNPSYNQLEKFFNSHSNLVDYSILINSKELFYKKRKVFNRKNKLKKIEKLYGI